MDHWPRLSDELLSADDVAQYLELEPVTIYRWCRDGRLPCMKLGKVWRIRRSALDAFLRRAEGPQTLAGHLGAFLGVPDQVLAVAEDATLLTRLDAAFFQVAEAHDGLLVKVYDPTVLSREGLREGLRRDGLDIDRLEGAGRFRWCPEGDPGRGVAAVRQLLAEETPAGRSMWVVLDWLGEPELEVALRQQEQLADLVAAAPLVVATGVVEPEMADWPGADAQWRLLEALRGVVRYSRRGLLLSRVVAPPQL
jgi:excisionase family DNA binding protein